METRRKDSGSSAAVFTFLKAVLAQPIPVPGQILHITTFSSSGKSEPDVYKLRRPLGNDFLLDYVITFLLL